MDALQGELAAARRLVAQKDQQIAQLQADRERGRTGGVDAATRQDIERLRQENAELRRMRSHATASQPALDPALSAQYCDTLDEAMARLRVAQQAERDALERAQGLSDEIAQLSASLVSVQAEAEENASQNAELVLQVQTLQASLQEAAQREISAFQQLKDSVDVFESVRLDRDEAVVRQKAAVDESETLRAKLQEYVDGGIERTKQQVSHHRSEATRRQASLVAALNESQDSVTQLRAELARALRHKRSAEEQLQQLKTAPSEQVEAFRASMQNMTRETAAARRASCEHRGQIATLEQELTMCKEEAWRAAERSEGSLKASEHRLGLAREDVARLRTQLSEQAAKLERVEERLEEAVMKRDACERQRKQEVATLRRMSSQAEADWEAKVRDTQEAARHSSRQAQLMVAEATKEATAAREAEKGQVARDQRTINDLRRDLRTASSEVLRLRSALQRTEAVSNALQSTLRATEQREHALSATLLKSEERASLMGAELGRLTAAKQELCTALQVQQAEVERQDLERQRQQRVLGDLTNRANAASQEKVSLQQQLHETVSRADAARDLMRDRTIANATLPDDGL